MFTADQIKQAHSKVKTGADFPAYIRAIKALGVISYQTFVKDGHTDFQGKDNFKLTTPPKYDQLTISEETDTTFFSRQLKVHQEGKTSFPDFCDACGKSGVEKWVVSTVEMTCSYFDTSGKKILVEQIPE